ncbi:relaxase/mobilization nuclease RlxS [Parasphingorhabdus sp.]|uniref:relaxase/mobilization nuclease RlxS n=1 Tax=Parasphingorhabdus sp. TaxID=2709688 RepID=UPI0039E546AB
MSDDDTFKPKLGRIRSKGGKKAKRFLHKVLAASALSGGIRRRGGKSKFTGERIGRGASVSRVLASGDRHSSFRSRRVVIKSRYVRLAGKGRAAAHAHLRYIERDGVTREGNPGELYSADADKADGKEFLERGQKDRHQFRFIVSAEDGAQYDDLTPLTRRFMAQMEVDLDTKLDWVAVDHFNTGHPHTHILLRGIDDRGKDLIIARDYLSSGMRERLSDTVTLDLGPRSDLEIEERLRQDIGEERLTGIDRRLIRDMDRGRIVTASDHDPLQQSLRAGRLQKLKALGLAEPMAQGRWQLADEFDKTLREMGERGDIIRNMQRDLTAQNLKRARANQIIHDTKSPPTDPIIGRIVKRGLSDEVNDRHYVIVDAIDGQSHYVEIGKGEGHEAIPRDAIIKVTPRRPGIRKVDQTIADVAAQNGGRYDIDAHLRYDPGVSERFAQTHVRRLEAMRRTMGSVEREADGRWIIAPDHLDKAAASDARQARNKPATIDMLSPVPLTRLPGIDAATWLDRELVSKKPEHLRDAGFGKDVRAALAMRRQWLVGQGLANEQDGSVNYSKNMIANLQRRELLRVAGQLSDESGLAFRETKQGEQIEGILKRRVALVSGKFAIIEKSREFTLVPWRPVLEMHIGKSFSGMMRSKGISWSIGRGREGPSIQ